jgi:hypothetical protein
MSLLTCQQIVEKTQHYLHHNSDNRRIYLHNVTQIYLYLSLVLKLLS